MPVSYDSRTDTGRSRTSTIRIKDDLAERLHGQIQRRARGQIRDLRVVCSEGLIVLQGLSPTHYVKQLAQEAVLDVTDGRPALANHIVVR